MLSRKEKINYLVNKSEDKRWNERINSLTCTGGSIATERNGIERERETGRAEEVEKWCGTIER